MKVGATTSALLSGRGRGFLRYSAQGLLHKAWKSWDERARAGDAGREKNDDARFSRGKNESAEIQIQVTLHN